MHTVHELLNAKGEGVYTISPAASALDAARKMNEHKIGSLVVMDGGEIAGIVTERDIMTRVVAAELSPSRTLVETVMTRDVATCAPSARLEDLKRLMRERRIRHIPVVGEGRIRGMVSIGDLNAAETRTLTETIGFLEAYIAG